MPQLSFIVNSKCLLSVPLPVPVDDTAMALQAPACYQNYAKLKLVEPVRYKAGAC